MEQFLASLDLVTIGSLAIVGVTSFLAGSTYSKPSGRVNNKINLDSAKVVHAESPSDKKVFCRCWKSNKFPFCDGTHNKHNETTGDNVGPLIIEPEKTVNRGMENASFNDETVIHNLCQTAAKENGVKKIAVVGLSNKPQRASYVVAQLLQKTGYKIFPVNPILVERNIQEVLGEPVFPDLRSINEEVDCVDVFRRSEHCLGVAEEVVDTLDVLGTPVFWLQQGVINSEALNLCSQVGLDCVQDKCIKIEIQRIKANL